MEVKRIKLVSGDTFALVDDADFEWLNQWKWYLDGDGYAQRTIWDKNTKKHKTVRMHRLIDQTPIGLETDHVNRNKLDNRKINLRTVSHQQNIINKGIQANNSSGIKGVHWHKLYKKWQVNIMTNAKRIYLGSYSTLQGAFLARKWGEKVYRHYGG